MLSIYLFDLCYPVCILWRDISIFCHECFFLFRFYMSFEVWQRLLLIRNMGSFVSSASWTQERICFESHLVEAFLLWPWWSRGVLLQLSISKIQFTPSFMKDWLLEGNKGFFSLLVTTNFMVELKISTCNFCIVSDSTLITSLSFWRKYSPFLRQLLLFYQNFLG